MDKSKLLGELDGRMSGNTGGKKRFNLLYKVTDKVDVDEFHTKCDNKGPTVTILQGKNCLFGGYTSKDWSSQKKSRTFEDKAAFLFTTKMRTVSFFRSRKIRQMQR